MKAKTIVKILAAAGFFYLGKAIFDRDPKNSYLTHQDFQNMQWCMTRNTDGIIWDNYIDMNDRTMPKNSSNWALFQSQVKERNKRTGLTGKILVPCRFQATDYSQNH